MLSCLLAWFHKVREPYFFRQDRNPYRVWISEVALQQTRIQAALQPLERFFSYFPDVISLAQGDEKDVLHAFRGLGYYSRAKNLKKGALYLVEKHHGQLPEDYDDLVQVPSIGEYTASAISSVCFGKKNPVLDGNVRRILSRILRIAAPLDSKEFTSLSYQFLRKLFDETNMPPGDLNEAMMELGQKICIKGKPKCQECPVCDFCEAFQEGDTHLYPTAKKKQDKVPVLWHLYIFQTKEKQILLQKWENFYFLKGHISFPSLLEFPQTQKQIASWPAPHFLETYAQHPYKALSVVKHSITKHNIQIHPYLVSCENLQIEDNSFFLIPQESVSEHLVASALSKVWQKFLQSQ